MNLKRSNQIRRWGAPRETEQARVRGGGSAGVGHKRGATGGATNTTCRGGPVPMVGPGRAGWRPTVQHRAACCGEVNERAGMRGKEGGGEGEGVSE